MGLVSPPESLTYFFICPNARLTLSKVFPQVLSSIQLVRTFLFERRREICLLLYLTVRAILTLSFLTVRESIAIRGKEGYVTRRIFLLGRKSISFG